MKITENKITIVIMLMSFVMSGLLFIASLDKRLAVHEQIDQQQNQQIEKIIEGQCHA